MAPGQPGRWPDGTWTDVSDFVVGEELAGLDVSQATEDRYVDAVVGC
jgi:hypothetical protein